MKFKLKPVFFMFAAVAAVLVSGCGSGGGTTGDGALSPSTNTGTPTTPPSTQNSAGAALYASNCAGCHGAITASTIAKPATLAKIKSAIAANFGGMGKFTTMSDTNLQSIADAVNNPSAATATPAPTPTPVAPTPAPTVDGAALYTANCSDCHGALATSSKRGVTLARLQTAISNNTGGMSFLTSLSSAQQQAIVTALNPGSTPAPAPTPTPTVDGAALYTANCSGCHGSLASSAKAGATVARIQGAIGANTGGMGSLSSLTSAQITAIAAALAPTVTPTPTPTPVTDGATLYATDCAGCHGALASSAKAGATASRIQTAITNNTGGMGSLSALSSTQVSAIATVLVGVTATPTPPPACGSCHAIPPATGHHSTHKSENIACATCHGSGYSTTTVNAATHNNGVKNLTTTIGWNAMNRSCSNSCHGTHSW